MNPIDIVVLVVIGLSAILAYFRGFVREILSIAALVAAVVAAVMLRGAATPLVDQLIPGFQFNEAIAAFGVFLIALIVLSIASHLISKLVENSAVTPIDRVLGLLFGIARGVLLVVIAYMVFSYIMPREEYPDMVAEAQSLPAIERGAEVLESMVPMDLVNGFMSGATGNESAGSSTGSTAVPGVRDALTPTTPDNAPTTPQAPGPAPQPPGALPQPNGEFPEPAPTQ